MDTLKPPPTRVREIAVSRWWNSTDLSGPLTTIDGQQVQIVFRGSWSHGLGPDFQHAMIDFGDGRLVSGAIEIHLRSSDWKRHGHHLDQRYVEVVLHAVLEHDSDETRRIDGMRVPVVLLEPGDELLAQFEDDSLDWSRVGGAVCAAEVSLHMPDAIRAAIWQLGDERLSSKVRTIGARLDRDYPADLLFELVMDGLGYSANRLPMQVLAQRMPMQLLDSLLALVEPQSRYALALGLLLGAGGFLPLSPTEAEVARISPAELTQIESLWHAYGGPWHYDRLAPSIWERVRVRPANHPLVRLGMAAALMTSSPEGLTAELIATVRRSGDPVQLLCERSAGQDRPGMGKGRATAIVASSVLPFLLALADSTDDSQLSEQASTCWEKLEAGDSNQVTRRAMQQVAGSKRIGRLGERGMQGLIQLDREWCTPRRCMECHIAHLALSWAPETAQAAIE